VQRAYAKAAPALSRPHFAEMLSDPQPTESRIHGEDQRKSPRQRVLLSALVVYADFNIAFRCGIRDVSGEGAKLKAPPGHLIPSDFLLIDVSAGKAYEARTAWRRYPFVGVSIRQAMDLKEPSTRLARRLRTLWLGVIN
jgi:hypothetical protein